MPLDPNYKLDKFSVSDIMPRAREAYKKMQQTTAGQFPGELAKNLGKTAVGIGQNIAKAPLNLAQTAADLPRQIMGKEPSAGYDVPGLGHVQGYGREAMENTPSQGPLAAGIGAVSHGILDTVGTAAIASKAVPALNTPLTNSPVKGLLNNLKSSTTDWDASIQSGDIPKETIYNSDGSFTPDATKHVLSDMAEKMNIHLSKGLGDKFLSRVDILKSKPGELLQQATNFIKSNYSLDGAGSLASTIPEIKDFFNPEKAEAVTFIGSKEGQTKDWVTGTDVYGDKYKSPFGTVGSLYTPTTYVSTRGPNGEPMALELDQFVNKYPVEGGTWDKYVARWLKTKPADMSYVDWVKLFEKEKANHIQMKQEEYDSLTPEQKNTLKPAITLESSPEAQAYYYYVGRGDFNDISKMKPLAPLTVKYYVPK